MSTQSTPETTGRDSQGRFTPGNKFGRGNPHARQCAALRATLMEKLSPVEMGILVECGIAMAMKGNASVLRLLFEYGLGKPLPGVNPDLIDLDEFHCLKAKAIPVEQVSATFSEDTIPVALAIPMILGVQMARTATLAETTVDALTAGTLPMHPVEEGEDLDEETLPEEEEEEPVTRPFPGPVNKRSGRTSAAANRAASTPTAPRAPVAPQRPSTPTCDPRDAQR